MTQRKIVLPSIQPSIMTKRSEITIYRNNYVSWPNWGWWNFVTPLFGKNPLQMKFLLACSFVTSEPVDKVNSLHRTSQYPREFTIDNTVSMHTGIGYFRSWLTAAAHAKWPSKSICFLFALAGGLVGKSWPVMTSHGSVHGSWLSNTVEERVGNKSALRLLLQNWTEFMLN